MPTMLNLIYILFENSVDPNSVLIDSAWLASS